MRHCAGEAPTGSSGAVLGMKLPKTPPGKDVQHSQETSAAVGLLRGTRRGVGELLEPCHKMLMRSER